MRYKALAVFAHLGDKASTCLCVKALDLAEIRLGDPPLGKEIRLGPCVPHGRERSTNDALDNKIKVRIHEVLFLSRFVLMHFEV